jgi:2-phosphosulfolactate phosphatase
MVSLRHEGGKMARPSISTSLQQRDTVAAADVCVVVDVLRATTTLVTMFERGLDEALIAPSIDEARRLALARPDWILCGEQGGLPPEGFHYGNSPVAFSTLDMRGLRCVFATTNGTKALHAAGGSGSVLVGALLNAKAVAEALASGGARRTLILCAGEAGESSLEDVFCAGAIVERALSQSDFHLDDGSAIALQLYRSFDGSAAEALSHAKHAASLAALGLQEDVGYCAQTDTSSLVPQAERDGVGAVRVTSSSERRLPVA